MTTTTDTHATSPYDQSEKRSFGERLDDWIDGFLDWFDRVVMRRGRTNTDDKPMRFSMTKAVVLNVTAVALLFAGYNGWVSLPDLSALGGMLGGLLAMGFIVGMFATVYAKSTLIRLFGLLGALVLGAALATMGADLPALFANFTLSGMLGLLLFIAWMAFLTFWLARSLKKPVVVYDTENGQRAPGPDQSHGGAHAQH